MLFGLAACTQPQKPGKPAALAEPASLPSALPVADLVGAHACAECHAQIHAEWQKSPLGRAMSTPSQKSVSGDFAAAPVAGGGGMVALSSVGGFAMEMQAGAHRERRGVDLVLASGRQHQLYVAHSDDGAYSLLPESALPRGNTRVTTVHVQITGAAEPQYNVRLIAAGDARGHAIAARASLLER